jgi:hypothetical protein
MLSVSRRQQTSAAAAQRGARLTVGQLLLCLVGINMVFWGAFALLVGSLTRFF